MKRLFNIITIVTGLLLFASSCIKDLDTVPLDKDVITSASVYENPDSYKQVLAKCYAGLAVSGQQGAAGMPDISGIDEGFGQYLRAYWYHQELPTDEAVIGWNDQTIKDFHWQTWGSGDVFIAAMYYRIFYQISLTNEYIRETTDDKLNERGVDDALKAEISYFRAEARFLRALSYYHALDLFGNVPFVTEADKVGAFFPPQTTRSALFTYLESELLAIEPLMVDARANEYARADKAAVWTLLAKLYLNAEVYTGVAKYAEAVDFSSRVINAGFTLEPEYAHLFYADNDQSDEIIFPIAYDGINTKTYGGTTFIAHAALGGSMVAAEYGLNGGWGGLRTTSALVHKFYPDASKAGIVSPIPPKSPKATYPVLYVPGSYQGWDPTNTTTVVASVLSDKNYEGYLYFPADTKFKFTDGPSWDVNFGDTGADGHLEAGGTDIAMTDEGMYKINVNMNDSTYTAVVTSWGIIGSATAGGWDSDQNMEYNSETGLLTATLDLATGAIKFRANDAWDVNLGDGNADGILEYGGGDIPVADAGTYVISLKLGAPDYTYTLTRASYDHRALFHTDGQNLEIVDMINFNEGWAVAKWRNITKTGGNGSDLEFVDIDFPMFRLADVYLMYAEAVLRGGGGSTGDALNYVNALRERSYGDQSGNITSGELTLPFILDERARELYWEGHRRTDLIRFGKFTTGDYNWPWKGNVPDGTSTSADLNLFPIPASDKAANPNLEQNPGYGN
ncbi:MAG: RagB/SusD family nutrient uptake outer membrane protein [Bacteroidales bacterium]